MPRQMKSDVTMMLLWGIFLGALVRQNIASNITQISFKSTSINYTSSGNGSASMNMSQTHEIVIKRDDGIDLGKFCDRYI